MNKLQEEIARVAYELFEKRGWVHGHEMQDWLKAEKIVMARHAKTKEDEGKAVKAVKRKTAAKKPKGDEAKPLKSPSKRKSTAKKTTTKKAT